MPYNQNNYNDRIRYLDENQTLLDMVLELEAVLDRLDLYAYRNWEQGALVSGPDVSRHFVAIDLLYPEKQMPDPNGALRLIRRGIPVKYNKDTFVTREQDQTTDEIRRRVDMSRGGGSYNNQGVVAVKNTPQSETVWIVTIQMPRKYLDSTVNDFIAIDDEEFIDAESLNDIETQVASDTMNPDMGVDDVNFDDTQGGPI